MNILSERSKIMKNMKWNFLFCLSFCFILSGCGDMFTKEEEEVSLTQGASCTLEIEAFSYILEKDIQSDIRCLQTQLDLFIDFVETDRPGFISKSVLKDFLINESTDMDPKTADIIDGVFEISNLILGTEKNYIKKDEMYKIIDFIGYFNSHIWKTYTYFDSPDEVNYVRHIRERNIVYAEVQAITTRLKEIFKVDRESTDTVNTEALISNFFKDDPATLEKIKSVMFLKKTVMGGQRWEITHHEFLNFINIIPDLTQVAFDATKSNRYNFASDEGSLLKLFDKDLEVLRNIFVFGEADEEAVFTVGDLTHVISTLTPNLSQTIDFKRFTPEFKKVKEVFLGSGGEFVSGKEIYTLIDHADFILKRGILFYNIYSQNSDDLNGPDRISHDFGDFHVNSSSEQKSLEAFARIASDYRFFKGSADTPFYTFANKRNASGFIEIMAIEYGLEQVMKYYGSKNEIARGGYGMTLDQFYKIAFDFKWIFKELGLVNIGREGGGELNGISENVILMSTLFQYQSNGCSNDTVCMEIPELTEFLVGLLTAINVKDFFSEKMTELCSSELDQYKRIAPECFRRNFLNVIEAVNPKNGISISGQMPLLHAYLKKLVADVPAGKPYTTSKGYLSFITETEAFTRTCTHYDHVTKKEEIPLRGNDAFAVFAGLLNIESVMLRFDEDQDNILNYKNKFKRNEILNAYDTVYNGAIKALIAPNGGFLERLAKPLFKYLVREGRVPEVKKFRSALHFARFLLRRNKNADAHRVTFATVLRVIGEQNDKDSKPFKCECFRDPTTECEPEGDEWN